MKTMNKAPSTKQLRLFSLPVIIILVAADQLIKYLVELKFSLGDAMPLIPGIIRLKYIRNNGAMLGLMDGKIEVMTVLSVVCIIAVFCYVFFTKIRLNVEYCAIIAIAAGGIGNIIDRIFRGYVVDYIEVLFVDFYIFNFADCLITCGAFVTIIYEIYLLVKEKKKEKSEKDG